MGWEWNGDQRYYIEKIKNSALYLRDLMQLDEAVIKQECHIKDKQATKCHIKTNKGSMHVYNSTFVRCFETKFILEITRLNQKHFRCILK